MPRAILLCFLAFMLAGLFVAGDFAWAQSSGDPQSTPVAPVVYSIANERVVRGAISQVITRPAAGFPLGLHLIVSSDQGTVDAHLGPYLASPAAQKGMIPGASVEMAGVTTHLPAGDVFLVRTIVVGGRTIVVRNVHGIPLRQIASGPRIVRGAQGKDGLE